MKKITIILITALLLISLVLATACQPETVEPEDTSKGGQITEVATDSDEDALRVVFVINGVQGDRSLIDSAVRGLVRAREELGIDLKIIEAGLDTAKWQSYLEDAAANEEYDILVAGSWSMIEYVEEVAPKYPDKKFIVYDGVSETPEKYENLYSVTFLQNEGAYIGGAYAGLLTKEADIDGINDKPILGIVGAQPIPVINDFIFAFQQGAEEVAGISKDDIIVQFAGGWNDPAKGKELAHTMYQQGADIVFQVAGGTGDGIFQAAKEVGAYAIGVDSDQYIIFEDANPDLAKVIVTSVVKNVDNSLFRAITKHLEGTLPYGSVEYLGMDTEGVGIAKNDYYEEFTPQAIKDKMIEIEEKIAIGEIDVISAFDEE